MNIRASSSFYASGLAFVITFLLRIPLVYGDALAEVTKADSKRIEALIKPGDVLVDLCRTCSTFGLQEGELSARQVISVEAIARKQPLFYAKDLPYQVIVTEDVFFSADSISESKDHKEITATGKCMIPTHYEVIFSDQRCIDYEGDSNVQVAFRCKQAASLNYTYFQYNGTWRNLATVSLDDEDAKPWADTVKLSTVTMGKIDQCRKAYLSSLQSRKRSE